MMVKERNREVSNKARIPMVCLNSGGEGEVKQMGH